MQYKDNQTIQYNAEKKNEKSTMILGYNEKTARRLPRLADIAADPFHERTPFAILFTTVL